ncbi:MAG: DUF655 domain-containing protein [Candidatus Diapherotrites archaeon]|nr:DUF655 domain-containing protein [Candidatus Diapherotrites archaeon]
MISEEKALVLDFLPKGRSVSHTSEPIAQVMGEQYFSLLEIIPKPGIELKPLEEAYIGREERPQVQFIRRRIGFDELTNNAKSELDKAIERVLKTQEYRFIKFFNTCGPLTLRLHQLELIPGLGKKHMQEILARRTEKVFDSYEDMEARVHLMPNPISILKRRIVQEMEGSEKYHLFARPPPSMQEREELRKNEFRRERGFRRERDRDNTREHSQRFQGRTQYASKPEQKTAPVEESPSNPSKESSPTSDSSETQTGSP